MTLDNITRGPMTGSALAIADQLHPVANKVASRSQAPAEQETDSDARLLSLSATYMDLMDEEHDLLEAARGLYAQLRQQCVVPAGLPAVPAGVLADRTLISLVRWFRDAGPKFLSEPTGLAAAGIKFQRDVDRISRRLGLQRLEQRLEEIEARTGPILDEIQHTPAHGMVGIVAKLRAQDAREGFSTVSGDSDEYFLFLKGETLREAERIAGLPLSMPFSTERREP